MRNSRFKLILSFYLLISLSCNLIFGPDPNLYPVAVPPEMYSSTVAPGFSYTFKFTSLPESPFASLTKNALIIKADDLTSLTTGRWQRYFFLVESLGIHSSAGLITSSFRRLGNPYGDYFGDRINRGCELWHHGLTHSLSGNQGDFCGTSLSEQTAYLATGFKIVEDSLGYTMHTFGAPGNCWDDTTITAITKFPNLKVWLGGTSIPGKLNIPIRWMMEASGHIYDLDTMTSRFSAYQDQQVVMFQIHPDVWTEVDFNQFEINMEYLMSRDDYVFMTPYEFFKIDNDRENIILSQLDSLTYTVDLTNAIYSHTFEFDADFTVVEH
ncbi:hypothetical protein ACFL6E_01645 [Candidatus Neomarinimicrobiota bacterium]